MRIALLEDDPRDLACLVALIERYAKETRLDLHWVSYDHPEALLADPQALKSDLLLLDIMMQGEDGPLPSGIAVARELRARGYDKALTFITSSQAFYPQGFEVGALHYLLKPPRYEDFVEIMRRTLAASPQPDRVITLPVKNTTVDVALQKILYVEVYGRETLVHTGDETLRIRLPLHKVIDLLGGDPFLHCFRSYVLNMDHVAQVEENHFVLRNGQRIPIAMRNRYAIKAYYLCYHLGPMRQEGPHD